MNTEKRKIFFWGGISGIGLILFPLLFFILPFVGPDSHVLISVFNLFGVILVSFLTLFFYFAQEKVGEKYDNTFLRVMCWISMGFMVILSVILIVVAIISFGSPGVGMTNIVSVFSDQVGFSPSDFSNMGPSDTDFLGPDSSELEIESESLMKVIFALFFSLWIVFAIAITPIVIFSIVFYSSYLTFKEHVPFAKAIGITGIICSLLLYFLVGIFLMAIPLILIIVLLFMESNNS